MVGSLKPQMIMCNGYVSRGLWNYNFVAGYKNLSMYVTIIIIIIILLL